MTRRSRSKRLQLKSQQHIDARQTKEVQGPQIHGQEPRVASVQLNADMAEKYLGRGLIGMGPYLEVLSNKGADELLAQHGYQLYYKMLMDSEVDASLDALIQASNSQQLKAISPLAVDDPDYKISQELADFTNFVFASFDFDSWRKEQLRQALSFGNAVSEVDWHWIDKGRWTGHMAVKQLRLQRPEDYGFITDRWGEIYGVAPMGAAAGLQFQLGNLIPLNSAAHAKLLEGAVPRYKLTVWTWEKRGTDPRGRSILIPAYIPWWSKQRTIEEWSCWLARYAQPSLWATPGPDALPVCITHPNGSQTITQPTEALLQALLQFKSASVLALPFGSKVELLNATGGAEPFLKSLDQWNKEITRAILGQHLATSEGDNQSRSAAEIHALVLRLLISSIRRFVANLIQVDIIKPMIEANYGDVGHLLPIVDLGDGDGFPPTVTEIAVLFQSGYFTSDQLTYVDKILGLPVRTTDDRVGPGNLPQVCPPDCGTPAGTVTNVAAPPDDQPPQQG